MKCPRCNSEIKETARFCDNCGQKIEQPSQQDTATPTSRDLIKCPVCGEFNYDDVERCTRCGTALSGQALNDQKEKSDKAKRITAAVIIVVAFFIAFFCIIPGTICFTNCLSARSNSSDKPGDFKVINSYSKTEKSTENTKKQNEQKQTINPTEAVTEKQTEEKLTEPPTEKETEPPTEAISREYQNALKKANSYLSHTAFSKESLYEQLLYEKYSEDAARYAVENVNTDWDENALKKAESYMSHTAFSKDGLYEQLIYEKFTEKQAQYAVDNIDADWNEAAVKKAESYLSHSAFSKEELYDQLIYEKFTPEQAQYAVDKVY